MRTKFILLRVFLTSQIKAMLDMQVESANCMTLSLAAVRLMMACKQCLSFGIAEVGLPGANLIKLEKVMGVDLF